MSGNLKSNPDELQKFCKWFHPYYISIENHLIDIKDVQKMKNEIKLYIKHYNTYIKSFYDISLDDLDQLVSNLMKSDV